MSTNDPVQKQMIRDAMKAIAERKPGRSKLVYDKANVRSLPSPKAPRARRL